MTRSGKLQPPYRNRMKDEGISESRVYDLENALETMHRALCRLDEANFKKFFENFTLEQRLDEFAMTEDLRRLFSDTTTI